MNSKAFEFIDFSFGSYVLCVRTSQKQWPKPGCIAYPQTDGQLKLGLKLNT